MKYREILLKQRGCRIRELEEYESFLEKSIDFTSHSEGVKIQREVMYQTESGEAKSAGIHSFTGISVASLQRQIEKRRQLLTLELPFLTNTVSLNHMLVKSFPTDIPLKFRSAKDWAEQYFSTESTDDQLSKEKHILSLINKYWPKIAKKFEFDGEEVKITEVAKAEEEDLISDKLKADLFYAIDQLPIAKDSKTIYKSRISSLIKYLLFIDSENSTLLEANEVNWSLKSELGAETLADYFEYLEHRCLKQQSDGAYKDLIAIKLLFYAPDTFKKLDQVCLKHIDKSNLTIQFEDVHFAVPASFITLAGSIFSKEDPLLRMNVKQLNKFVQQTSEANKMKKITPTAIRQALRFICHQERFAVEYLSRR